MSVVTLLLGSALAVSFTESPHASPSVSFPPGSIIQNDVAGSCELFAGNAGVCDTHLSGAAVFVPAGQTQSSIFAANKPLLDGVLSLAAVDSECARGVQVLLCLFVFPGCLQTPAGAKGLLTCQDNCLNVRASCNGTVDPAIFPCEFAAPRFIAYTPSRAVVPCLNATSLIEQSEVVCAEGMVLTPDGLCTVRCPVQLDSQAKEATLRGWQSMCGFISLFASLLIIVTWGASAQKRAYPGSIVLCLNISSFIVALGFIISLAPTDKLRCRNSAEFGDLTLPACAIQAILLQFGILSMAFWWLCLAVNVYASGVQNQDLSAHFNKFQALCWSVLLKSLQNSADFSGVCRRF
eukprot:TRINITY_DN5_c0_g3_i2.p1 TRINITY_DN5_c0_g3~~TRINITY_DN5_c0_g3_i2.p1  ORF type:complete len:350 (-),score=57.00 TRINITY_DN5_c0_g3_i2:765-1814(-)